MSAKLLKKLAAGSCSVRNITTGECRVYYGNRVIDIPPGASINLFGLEPSAKVWRKSESLRKRVHDRILEVL